MNPNDPRMRLITAALDGEISAAERKKLRRLFRSDPEFLASYRVFRRDKEELSSLAAPVLPVDFSRSVGQALQRLNEKEIDGQRILVPVEKKGGRTFSIQWQLALAFSVAWLLGLTFLASLLVGSGSKQKQTVPVIADSRPNHLPASTKPLASTEDQQVQNGLLDETTNANSAESWTDWLLPDHAADRHLLGKAISSLETSGQTGLEGEGIPIENPSADLLGAPSRPSRELEELSLNLPHIISWNDLGSLSGAFHNLKDKSGTIQLDLPAVEPGQAVEILLALLKAQKKGVVVDGLAMDRLRRGNIRAHYMVVLEDVDSKQLENILKELKSSDVKLSGPKSAQLGSSLVVSSPETARKQLKSMTGWDFGSDVPAKKVRAGAFKDLVEETAQQALKAIESGTSSRIAGKSQTSMPSALVVAFSPYYPAVKTQPQSVEVRRFLEIRQATVKSGLGRAILVFRN